MKVTLDDITRARERLKDHIQLTPVGVSRSISARLGGNVHLKFENLQTTGSFKVRGAFNKILTLEKSELARGLIAASAGNHAQGVAYAATRLGVRAKIVMPETAPLAKVLATQGYGGEVLLHGRVYDEAYQHARALSQAEGLTFVPPFEDEAVIAGQGTLGLELLEQLPELDAVVVPIGGGGLIAGLATALKALKPDLKVYGVVSDVSPGMLQMFRGVPVDPPLPTLTIADGISVKRTSRQMFESFIGPLVDDIVAVTDEEIAESIVYFLERAKTLVEGSAAVVLAGATKANWDLGRQAALVLSGGNIDLNLVSKTIERGLSVRGRLARLTVISPDRPGQLMKLTEAIAGEGANILDVTHNRVHPDIRLSETLIEFLLEIRGEDHLRRITQNVLATGVKLLKSAS